MRRITHLHGSAYFTIPLTAEAVTGSPAMVETEFTESKCSEEIVDEKVKGEDEEQVTMLQLLRKKIDLGNSNLRCLKLSEFPILGIFTCTLLAPIVIVPLL